MKSLKGVALVFRLFPPHLVSVHQTSQSTMGHLPQAGEAAHTFLHFRLFLPPLGNCLVVRHHGNLSHEKLLRHPGLAEIVAVVERT